MSKCRVLLKKISDFMESLAQDKQKAALLWYAWLYNDFNFNGISDYLEQDQ